MCCASGNGGTDICDPFGIKGLCYNPGSNKYWRESCTDVSLTTLPHAEIDRHTDTVVAILAKHELSEAVCEWDRD